MKKTLICLAIFASIIFAVFGMESLRAGAKSSVSSQRTVKVGFFQFDGYHNIDENGTHSGYGYDFLQKINLYNDWKYEYAGYDKNWADMQDMLENGDIDILTSAQKTPEREAKYDFSSDPIGTSATILTVKEGNTKYVSGEYHNYNGMRVGIIEGNSRNDSLKKFAKTKGFTYTTVAYDDVNAMKEALQDGTQIDAILTSNLRRVENEWILDQFDSSYYYAMVKKGDTDLLERINYGIEQLDRYEPGWRTELFDKYYTPKSTDEVAFSSAEKEYMEKIKGTKVVFTAVVNPDRAPYSYFEDGEAKGIFVDIFKKMASQLGIKYKILQTTDRDSYRKALADGKADIWIDACAEYWHVESNNYKLTSSYLSTTLSKITVKKNKNNKNPKVAALRHADMTRVFQKSLYPKDNTIYYDSLDECIEAVKSGKADCTYAYTYTAQKMMQDDVRNILTDTVMQEYSMNFAVAVSSQVDHRLATIFDKTVDTVKGEYTQSKILSYTQMQDDDFSLIAFVYENPFVVLFFAVVVFIMLFIIIVFFVRYKSIRKRQKQEAELVRYMGYVCRANDMVMEVDLKSMKCKKHTLLEDGSVTTTVESYHQYNGINYDETIYPEDFDTLIKNISEENLDQMINESGGEKYFECRSKDETGKYQWHSYTLQTIPKDAEHPRNFVLFKKNIDSAKKEEEEKRNTLRDALQTAQKASQAKGAFLSKMSHEIRTPLNAVIGYLSIAKMSDDNIEKIHHCIDNGELAAKHLLNIINDVLDVSAIESGRIKIASESFDFKKLMTTISTIFYNQAKEHKVNFAVTLQEITEEWVVGDELRVNQILMNLLSNAVKFTPENGKVLVDVTQIQHDKKSVMIKFEVSDTGIGMSEEYMSRLFTPFEQESAKTAQKYGGTGLGLSITKNLVTMMGGSIDVKSVQNEGTTFTVILPFGYSEENEKIQSENAEEVQHDFSKVRVLVVDDAKSDRDYIKALLKRCGVKSDTVSNGEKAIKQILLRKDSDYPYDMCILDWNMEGMNGVETAKRIHEECSDELPIIIATAYDATEFDDVAKEAGVLKVVSKPLFQSSLFDILVSAFGKYTPEIPEELENATLQGIHVLLAEDNAMNMEIALDILEKAGISVDTAVDGKEAYDKFTSSAKGAYQAILMDVQMPVMDGYEATRQIRKSSHPEAASMPIIAMTANAFSEDISDALACGMNDHIAKPIDYKKLFKVLRKLM